MYYGYIKYYHWGKLGKKYMGTIFFCNLSWTFTFISNLKLFNWKIELKALRFLAPYQKLLPEIAILIKTIDQGKGFLWSVNNHETSAKPCPHNRITKHLEIRGSASGCSVNIRAVNTFCRNTNHVSQSSNSCFHLPSLSQPTLLWELIPRSEQQIMLQKSQQHCYWGDCKKSPQASDLHVMHHMTLLIVISSNHQCDNKMRHSPKS